MSDIQFNCPSCGRKLSCSSNISGKSVKCPTCQNILTVPYSEPEPEPIVVIEEELVNVTITCPSCKVELEIPKEDYDKAIGEDVECPNCNKAITITAPDAPSKPEPIPSLLQPQKQPAAKKKGFGINCPHCGSPAKLSSPNCPSCKKPIREKAFPQSDNTAKGYMLFATCPRCNRDDVCAKCVNCYKHNEFAGSGAESKCSCGMLIPESVACPFCNAAIFSKDFMPNPEKERNIKSTIAQPEKTGGIMNIVKSAIMIALALGGLIGFLDSCTSDEVAQDGTVHVEILPEPVEPEMGRMFKFGQWKKDGNYSINSTLELSSEAHPSMLMNATWRFEYKVYDAKGVILDTGTANWNSIKPGEITQISITCYKFDNAKRITLMPVASFKGFR